MKNILVTGIGGDLGQSISRCIYDSFKEIRLVGSDVDHINSGNIFVDNLFILPKANDPNYLNELILLLEKEKIDIIIPGTEEEIKFFANFNLEILKPKVIGVYKNIWSVGHDKYETFKFLKNNNLACPETFLLSKFNKEKLIDLIRNKKELILKPKIGSGSKAVCRITSIDDISHKIFQEGDLWILQEYIPDEEGEFTIAVSRLDQKLNILQLKRKLIGDSTGYAEVVNYTQIENYVKAICNCFDGNYAFNIQLRLKELSPFAFEINPRFSSTVYARHLLGFPDLAVWVSHYLSTKEEIKFEAKVGDYFQRYFSYKINRF